MKNIYFFMTLCAVVILSACNSDDDVPVVAPLERGVVVDDMGNSYGWVRIGDLDWTTSNAMNGPGCYDATYEGNWGPENVFDPRYSQYAFMRDEYIPAYGNLMSYDDAIESAPEGWRLPSDEDWKNLERALGMKDPDNLGWRGDGILPVLTSKESGSQLGLRFGGGIIRKQSYGMLNLTFLFFKEYGYFWTSTVDPKNQDDPMAYFRKIVFGVDGVERQAGSQQYLLSVRWCRDAK